MKVVRISAIFLVLMVVGVHQGQSGLTAIWTVMKFASAFSSKLLEAGFAHDLITDDTGEKLDRIYSSIKDMMKEQKELSKQLSDNVGIMMNNLAADLKNDHEFNNLRTKLTNDYIGRIRSSFEDIQTARIDNYTSESMLITAQTITSPNALEVKDNLRSIRRLIADGGSLYFSNFIDVLLTRAELQSVSRCGKGTSLQQEVYQLYELLVSTEQLAFSILSYAYTIQSTLTPVNYTNEIKSAETQMVDRTREYMRILKNALTQVSTEIHRCEPAEYIRNENFIELERLNQVVFLPENQTSTNRGCGNECRNYRPSDAPYLATDISGQNGIFGKNCYKCGSAGKTSICYPKNNTESHRYLAVTTNLDDKGEKTYGDMTKCYEYREGVYPPSEYYTHISSINSKCDICYCTCVNHEIDPKWRYSLSLKPELSDVSQNMVVTGIRFHKTSSPTTGQVIYPQIQTGKLLPDGKVTEVEWKEPEINRYYEPKREGETAYVVFGQNPDEVNFVNIDDAYVQQNHVVTGVKFIYWDDMFRVKRPWYWVQHYKSVYEEDKGKSVSIVVRMTRYNFTTGQLFPASSSYRHPNQDKNLFTDNPMSPRNERDTDDKDIPTKASKIKPVNYSYYYVRFSLSDMEKDLSQSTVPFFDIQEVKTSPPAPLSGVGLFAKDETGYAPFLAFRIMTLDMADVIDDGVPRPEVSLSDRLPLDARKLILPPAVIPNKL